MPGIPEETIEEIRRRADIVSVVEKYVDLRKRGGEFWACCPFHREKTPSFKVSPAYQGYHCFGCGAGGNVFQFVMSKENVDFVGAVHLLAQRFNVIVPESGSGHTGGGASGEKARRKEKLFACLREIGEWYRELLSREEGATAREYLLSRGLNEEALKKFGIGYAPDSWDKALQWGRRHGYSDECLLDAGMLIRREDGANVRIYDRFRNRIMFPIQDELGRIVGFSGRSLEDNRSAKYINTPETALFHKGKILYGLDLARPNMKKHGFALVCEGQLDVIACHRAGFDNAVAPQGTAFTENHARILKRFTSAVQFAFDSDSAGLRAAAKSIEVALGLEMRTRVVSMPEGDDPDSILRASGEKGLAETLGAAEDAMEFLFRFACRDEDPETVEGKDAIARFLVEIFSVHPSSVSRSAYCQWLGRRLAVPESAVFEMLNRRLRRQKGRRSQENDETEQLPTTSGTVVGSSGEPDSQVQSAIITLLDLALYHGAVAHRLADELNRDYLGHNSPAMALNLVLDETENGNHAAAGQKLSASMELMSDPRVSRVIAQSQYPEIPLETDSRHQRKRMEELIKQASDDCLAVIELSYIERNLRQLDQEIEKEADSRRQRGKMIEYQNLMRRTRQLRK